MKRLLITASLILATAAGSASAMTGYLSQADRAEVRSIIPTADLNNLSDAQIAAIGFLLSGERRERGRGLRSVLAWN